jgi:patatin-like phospholipase/acyl hydrolase
MSIFCLFLLTFFPFIDNVQIEEDYYSKMHNDKKIKYNVLSIDGGGLRGIIPCVWLSEIESRTRRPISHMFNMISGTSTGAIIGSALTLPKFPNKSIPKFYASDILDIYILHGSSIFANKKSTFMNLFSSKYSDSYRSNLMENFSFKDHYLLDSLTDLVVPALKKDNLTKTFLFSTDNAKNDQRLNFSYYDMLMSTSAAPTFFPAHVIKEHGTFIDGGLTFNDPTELACNEAARTKSISDENMFVLSLGTGSFFPECTNKNDGLFDFLFNSQNYLFAPQSGWFIIF